MLQTTPVTSLTRVIRRLTASTIPLTVPMFTRSPTPYWSSRSMKIPARKSCIRFCAPNPMAMPSTPALASTGARLIPRSPRMVIPAIPKMTRVAAFCSTEPSALARCWRRSRNSTRPRSVPVLSALARATTRRITRCTANLITTASSSTKRIRPASRAGPAKNTSVSEAALTLCVMFQTSRHAMPGSLPQAESRPPAGAGGGTAWASTSVAMLTAGSSQPAGAGGVPGRESGTNQRAPAPVTGWARSAAR